jgi:hypothetical protein
MDYFVVADVYSMMFKVDRVIADDVYVIPRF